MEENKPIINVKRFSRSKKNVDFELETQPEIKEKRSRGRKRKVIINEEPIIDEEEDRIILQSEDPILKISLSYGLSQSAKLAAFEHDIDQTIQRTRQLPAELAEKGKISLSRKKISQHIGKLFSQKNSINLESFALDTPEFFWKRPRYEPIYQMSVEFLDIQVRLNILNDKLNVVHELYEILSNELKHAHSSFLEWVIIILILVEVILSILKDFLPRI